MILSPSRSEGEAKAWRTFSSNLFGFIFGSGRFFSNIPGSTELPKPSPAREGCLGEGTLLCLPSPLNLGVAGPSLV